MAARGPAELLAVGDRAWLVEVGPDEVPAWTTAIGGLDLDGVEDVVPAARTVLVRFDDPSAADRARERLAALRPDPDVVDRGDELVTIPVRYDGADLAEVADACDATPEEVVAWHTGRDLVVAFCGFAPGFAYLRGLEPRLQLPRRPTPRTRVPAGAVAIAADMSAVYPTSSPGGWHLIGSTDTVVWDVARRPPALLRPGVRVRFVEADVGGAR